MKIKLFGHEVEVKFEKPEDRFKELKSGFKYHIRHNDSNWDQPVSVEKLVVVNYYCSVISEQILGINKNKPKKLSHKEQYDIMQAIESED